MHRNQFALIGVSLFFAAAMLLSSYLLAGSEYSDTAQFMLIALWWIPFSCFLSSKKSSCCGSNLNCSTAAEE